MTSTLQQIQGLSSLPEAINSTGGSQGSNLGMSDAKTHWLDQYVASGKGSVSFET